MPRRPVALAALALLALCCAAQAQDAGEQISCRVHVVNNTASPTSNMLGHVRSSLKVLAAADIQDVSVIVQVQHPDVAALKVSLTAAATSKDSSTITLKAPATGVTGGANMIQTIFSDYAPTSFPNTAVDAPYSAVYKPAEPLSKLTAGDSTAAGTGGSQGVWTLTVTDTTDTSRPLKLTGWELWLCGAADGPLFAPGDVNTTAFDGSDVVPEMSIVKKKVAVPSKSDVAAVVKTTLRNAQVADDPIAVIEDQVNTFLAKKLSQKVDKLQPLLDSVSAPVAQVLNSSLLSSVAAIKGMPKLLGYIKKGDRWQLPTSEAAIKDFLDTLVHCHRDLYWCWQKTGLEGNFAQDFVQSWEQKSRPVMETYAKAQDQWLSALANLKSPRVAAAQGGDNSIAPAPADFSDVLYMATIGTLYRAAALDAVATVAETWTDTAIRLALYLSPLRFAVNPRAAFVQTLGLVEILLRTVFNLFTVLDQLTDGVNNNDVPAITAFTQTLVTAAHESLDILTQGLRTRSEYMQKALVNSAGGLARGAAGLNEKIAETLGVLDPRLGSIYNSTTEGINNMLEEISASQQDAVERYLRAATNQLDLSGTLDETLNTAGAVIVQLATNAATAMQSAQKAMEGVMPGPNLQQILTNLRSTMEGIMSDGRAALEKVLPIPELEEMDALMRATIQSTLDIMDQSLTVLNKGEGAQAIQQQLGRLSNNLLQASAGVGNVLGAVNRDFPGPMLNSTLQGIRAQGARAATNIERMFQELGKQYPNLDPANFINELGTVLESLTTNTFDMTSTFENVAGTGASRQLGQLLPGALAPVQETLSAAAKSLPALASRNPAGSNPEQLSQIQAGVARALETFAGQIRTIADALPNQPPVPAITGRLSQRANELSSTSSQLNEALANAVTAPADVAKAGLDTFNIRLQNLLDDLRGQQARAGELGQVLAAGPLGDIAKGLSNIMAPVTQGMQALTSQFPPLRETLDATMSGPLTALGATLKNAADVALQAGTVASQGGVQALAGMMEQLTGLMTQGQIQVANVLSAAARAADQVQAAAPKIDVKAPMQALDVALSGTVQRVASELTNSLKGLAPPPQVVNSLVVPMAERLNKDLGNLLQGLGTVSEGGLPALLQGTADVVGQLFNGASVALGMPGTAAGTMLAGSPAGMLNPANLAAVSGPAQGRHLLANGTIADLPADFDATAFRQAIGSALQNAGNQFATAAVSALNGQPGTLPAVGALQQYVGSISAVGQKLQSFLALLPKGKILSVILNPTGQKVVDSLLGLQAGLKSAAPAEQAPILAEISNVLKALAADGSGADAGTAVQAALQSAAKQVLPQAADVLGRFRTQLAAATGGN